MTRSQLSFLLSTALAGCLVVAASGDALAQYQPYPSTAPPPPSLSRTGFTAGGGFGFGDLGIEGDLGDSSSESVFFEAHLGGMLRPNLALVVELWGSVYNSEFNETISQGNAGIAAQYWLSPRFWLKGGLGSSRLKTRVDGRTTFDVKGGAGFAAAGYELLHRLNYSLDLQLRFTGAGYETESGAQLSASSGSLQVGFSWF